MSPRPPRFVYPRCQRLIPRCSPKRKFKFATLHALPSLQASSVYPLFSRPTLRPPPKCPCPDCIHQPVSRQQRVCCIHGRPTLNQHAPPCACACHLSSPSVAGHRCAQIGYAEFNPSSWPSKCAPDWESWMLYPDMEEPEAICGTPTSYVSINYPEEFWSCSDITIEPGASYL